MRLPGNQTGPHFNYPPFAGDQYSFGADKDAGRRYGMNANLIHKWLRDSRFGPVAEASDAGGGECDFLPIEVEASALAFAPLMEAEVPPAQDAAYDHPR